MTQKFYVTFGVQYKHKNHPKYAQIDPDGYVAIYAKDYHTGRAKAFEFFESHFAFFYEDEPKSYYFPLGEIGRIVEDKIEFYSKADENEN